MRRRAKGGPGWARVVLALGLVATGVEAAPRAAAPHEVLGELLRRIRASGRAEAVFERSVPDPLGGGRRVAPGRVAIEPPDRVDVRFTESGERIALRADGGEWLQPGLGQMLRLGPEHAAAARLWSRLLLIEGGADLQVRRLAPGRYRVVAPSPGGGSADSATVWLAATGLPERLEIVEEAAEATVYRFSGWRFSRPRGPPAFVIDPPKGFEVVRLP